MVLKRLLVTTLGALGLGALAAGPASAQQIPAPDLFDGQVACSSNVPDGAADGPLATALAEVVMDGNLIWWRLITLVSPTYRSTGSGPELHHPARE